MPTKSNAIKNFLNQMTHKDLANLYSINMECQVNVAQDGGERVDGEFKGRKWLGWTDGATTWKPFRIPYKAYSEPEYTDTEIRFDLAEHAEGIGMTGWDWKNLCSKWVAFDFDAIVGHSEKHSSKLTNVELEEIRESLSNVDWITIRKSTSGTGLHIYVFLDDIPTENHNEHAALARSILGKMSAIVGYDFESKVDVCGGNMWVWHRKMQNTDGLELIKQGTVLSDVPPNWRDHLKVVTKRRRKNLPQNVDQLDAFEELTGQYPKIRLDDEHRKLINYLSETEAMWWWDQDHHMLVTHTWYLQKARNDLNLRGFFKTNSDGQDLNEQNCFSGDTEIITREGIKTLKELQGKNVELLVETFNGLRWVKSSIKSFGQQETIPIQFGDGSVVRTTKNHGWLFKDPNSNKIDPYLRKYTTELKPGKTELPLAIQDLPKIDWEGFAHGFVFGDGWLVHNKSGNSQCNVALFGTKEEVLNILLKFGDETIQKINGSPTKMVLGLPDTWKDVPIDCTKNYALGFILGLIAADGFVSDHSQIFQSDYENLVQIKRLATYAGLRTYPIRYYGIGSYRNAKTNYAFSITHTNLTKDYFVKSDQRSKFIKRESRFITIKNIDYNDFKTEEVFCAQVPKYHNFTLANSVITGNCFCHPLRRGAWVVRRYSQGCQEHESWDQDSGGWTRTFLNKDPDLATAARAYGGIEDPKGGFQFREAELAIQAAGLLGVSFKVANPLLSRKTKLKEHKDGRLVVEVERDDQDRADEMSDWLPKGKNWERVFNHKITSSNEVEVGNYDDIIRHLVTESGEDYGWMIQSGGEWRFEPLSHVRVALSSMGLAYKEIQSILGSSVFRCWKVVNKPFQPEYPGDRQWNRNAAQLKFLPTQDKEDLNYPTWLKILRHCGSGIDEFIKDNPWAKANGILDGADYLKCWIASLFQEPIEPLPYLFFYGPQNSGKSILHEALDLLLTKGYKRADAALISQTGFNAELEGSIICVVEETDLRKNKTAYNRIKDWVTSRQLLIHPKGKTPYHVPNTSHWIQCSNDHQSAPPFSGDTRITMVHVDNLEPEQLIPKKELIPQLEKEAPDFLAEILNLEIPPSNDRLNVPALATDDKRIVENLNKTQLQLFIEDRCREVPGCMIKVSEFFDQFREWLDPDELHRWSKIRIGRELPPQFPKGRNHKDGQFYIGNLWWRDTQMPKNRPSRIKLSGEFLEQVN